jgi:hypothetical protein
MDGMLCMIGLSGEKGRSLLASNVRQVLCTTPAIVDGRFYCRQVKRVMCFDRRKAED